MSICSIILTEWVHAGVELIHAIGLVVVVMCNDDGADERPRNAGDA